MKKDWKKPIVKKMAVKKITLSGSNNGTEKPQGVGNRAKKPA